MCTAMASGIRKAGVAGVLGASVGVGDRVGVGVGVGVGAVWAVRSVRGGTVGGAVGRTAAQSPSRPPAAGNR